MDPLLFRLHARVEDRHWWFVARRAIVSKLIGGLPLPSGSRLVDVGCGTGGNVASFSDRFRCLGVDPSRDAVDLARERFPGVEFRVGSARDLPDGEADVILLMDVLEHVQDDHELLTQAWRACRPGGYLLITVPAGPHLWSSHDEHHGHYRRYRQSELVALWDDLECRPLLVSPYNSRLYPLIWAIRQATRALRVSAGEHGTDMGSPPPLLNGLLRRTFSGEGAALSAAMRRGGAAYRWGTSYIALLQRSIGTLSVPGSE
jgi:SAM-dependent methyltransferase